MNLLQYLIAPHEQQQETEQDQLPQHQDLTQNAHYSQAPVSMPIHQRRTPPSYTHSPVSQQGQQSSGTSGVLDREQLILSLEANPDVLASLIRTGGIAGLTTTLQHAQQTGSVTQHSSHGYSTGSPNRAVRSQALQISSHAATVENRQICFWWYHTGNCNRHPQSSNFNATNDHCSYLHELTSDDDILQFFPTLWHHGKGDCGLDRCRFSSTYRHLSRPFQKAKKNKKLKNSLQQSRQQSQIGDQELLQQQSHQQSPQLHRSSTPVSTQQHRSPSSAQHYRSPSSVHSTGSGNGQSGSFKAINAPFIPPPRMSNIPTGPAADRYGSDQHLNYRLRYQQESSPSTKSLKRKASAMSSPIDPATMVIPTGPKLSKKAAKHERKQAKQARKARKAQLALNAPTTPPKYFDIVPSLTSGFPPHSSTPAKKKTQTCFFWYHETCANTGPKCHLLHALLAGPLGEPYGQVEDNEDEHEAQAEDEDERRVNDRDDDKYERMHGLERARKKREIDECWKKHTQQQQEDGDDEQDEQDEQDEHGEHGSDDVVMGDCDSDLDLGHEEGEINEVDGEWYMEGAADA
ncbi:hypothetical protein D6D28_10157 [Aureobasidium pullulans]|uniref:C3H1-type domain-containing protein n=1 Tax=Aureobasidium pullulans TaxID=5580 RepID=A0A4S8RYR8_AURPU|nr:hypothetical protein D6D28_10157 [Aureobasidium pullulans]